MNVPEHRFKKGDIVVCIDNICQYKLIKGEKYEVISSYISNSSGSEFIKIKNAGKDYGTGYFISRFVSEIEYDANKYNM